MRVGGIMATFADLPDSVLLEIFSYLPVRDRIRVSRVCHRWKRLVDDRWLWRHVDLTLYTAPPPPYIVVYSSLWVLLVVACGTLPRRGLMSRAMSAPRIRTSETLGRLQQSARS
uniref:F-box and leucine rich repeat protein 12 n=1 Tax=Equus caballus TaxID=9796 RepID=A0A9L0SBP4_HORSE